MNVLKSKGGYVLVWVMVMFSFFMSWVTCILNEIKESTYAKWNIRIIEERLEADKLMIRHFETSTENFDYHGKFNKYTAFKDSKKISVNVVGTTNLNYVYVIIEDGSLVLETMEE